MKALVVVAALVGCRSPASPPEPAMAIVISVQLPGAGAELVEHDVVEPIERAVAPIRGVSSIASRAAPDLALVTLELTHARDLDQVTLDVRRAITEILPALPAAATPPAITRARLDDRPVLSLAVRGPLPIERASELAREVVAPALERVPGVATVDRTGAGRAVVVVRPDLARLAAAGVTVLDLVTAIRGAAIDVPGGRIVDVSVRGTIGLDALNQVVVRTVEETPIRLADVASIASTFEAAPWVTEPQLAVRAQPGVATSQVTAAVRAALAGISLPAGVTLVETAGPPAPVPAALVASIRGPDWAELNRIADAIAADLRREALVVVRDPDAGVPERVLVPDRERAALLGISLSDIVETIRAVTSTAPVGTVDIAGHARDVVLRLEVVDDDMTLRRVNVRGSALVSLADVVAESVGTGGVITHRDRQRAITLSIQPPAGRARAILAKRAWPAGYRVVVTP